MPKTPPPLAPEVVGSFTQHTKVIISFGGAFGGFEFAMQLRHDIMRAMNQAHPAFCYLDAISLQAAADTRYPWDERYHVFKMQNPHWAQFYESAMSSSNTMIFLLSANWLKSWYCWEEFDWFVERMDRTMIKPIFVVFKDARDILEKTSHEVELWGEIGSTGKYEVKKTRTTNPKDWAIQMQNRANTTIIDIESEPQPFDAARYQILCEELDRLDPALRPSAQVAERRHLEQIAFHSVKAYDPAEIRGEKGVKPATGPYDHTFTFSYSCSNDDRLDIIRAIQIR